MIKLCNNFIIIFIPILTSFSRFVCITLEVSQSFHLFMHIRLFIVGNWKRIKYKISMYQPQQIVSFVITIMTYTTYILYTIITAVSASITRIMHSKCTYQQMHIFIIIHNYSPNKSYFSNGNHSCSCQNKLHCCNRTHRYVA